MAKKASISTMYQVLKRLHKYSQSNELALIECSKMIELGSSDQPEDVDYIIDWMDCNLNLYLTQYEALCLFEYVRIMKLDDSYASRGYCVLEAPLQGQYEAWHSKLVELKSISDASKLPPLRRSTSLLSRLGSRRHICQSSPLEKNQVQPISKEFSKSHESYFTDSENDINLPDIHHLFAACESTPNRHHMVPNARVNHSVPKTPLLAQTVRIHRQKKRDDERTKNEVFRILGVYPKL